MKNTDNNEALGIGEIVIIFDEGVWIEAEVILSAETIFVKPLGEKSFNCRMFPFDSCNYLKLSPTGLH